MSQSGIAFSLVDASGAPVTGASPTFSVYKKASGTSASAPSVSNVGSGLYAFNDTAPTSVANSQCFLIDANSGSNPRYLAGSLGDAVAFLMVNASGTPTSGLSPTFTKYADFSGTAKTPPSISDLGSGLYAFQPSSTDLTNGREFLISAPSGYYPALVSGTFISSGSGSTLILNRPNSGSTSMSDYKQSTSVTLPVMLMDSTGAAITGALYTDVTVNVRKADGTTTAVSLSSGDWSEDTGAFAGTGSYNVKLPSTALSVLGPTKYVVTKTGALPFVGTFKVVANEEADTKTVVDAIRSDYTTTRAGKIDNLDATITSRASAANYDSTRAAKLDNLDVFVSSRAAASDLASVASDLTAIEGNVDVLLQVSTGRWKIDTVTKQMLFYASDGSTVLYTYNLKGSDGLPTSDAVTERVPA